MKHIPKSLSDEMLLQLYLKKQEPAYLGELLQRYTVLLIGVCMKYLKNTAQAEEMVQQVFAKVVEDIEQYSIQNFGAWIYRVTTNACITEIRKKKYHEDIDKFYHLTDDTQSNAEIHWMEEQTIVLLQEAIQTLKEEQRICIDLFYLQRKTYTEITEITGYDYKAIKSYIQNGKRNLKVKLEKNENFKWNNW